MTTMLKVSNLEAGYGPIQVLRGVDLYVDEAEVVVLLGANGAGKTTTIRAICQMIDTKGSVDMCGVELVGMRPEKMAGKGMAHVPQGRGTFPELTVEENLQVGAYVRKDRAAIREDIDHSYTLFPRLGERRGQLAGSLSGGEQQMLAVARALVQQPKVLLIDEMSMGLAPIVVEQLLPVVRRIADDTGAVVLLVEQHVGLALEIADEAIVLVHGEVALRGAADDLRRDPARLEHAYLGDTAA